MGTKNRIMEESLKLFLKNGFSDVSLSEIKQSSNITTGGFYHYFQSKDDLLIEVIETYIFDYFKSTMLRLRKCTGTPQDKLKIVMLSLIGDAHLSDSVIIDYRTLHSPRNLRPPGDYLHGADHDLLRLQRRPVSQ